MVIKGQDFNPPPLVGQPERQATDSMLGYDYQIWRTVELWMQLHPDEVLYLECAEDFDLVTTDSATTCQVKNSPNNITLGSKDVRDAIVNHWTNVQKNIGRSVKMRFLTRGDIGIEKGKPFGDERGIDVWRRAAKGDAQADQCLTSHLQNVIKDTILKQFLETSTLDQRRQKLYGAIEWVVKEPVIDAVQISVRRAAIERGNEQGVATHMSENAVHALLAKCRQVAKAKEPEMRSLTTQDLQAVFDESTSIRVPATQALIDMLGQTLALATPSGPHVAFSPFAESGELPPLPAFVMPRTSFCASVLSALASGPVLIVGSEGKGKSIVANLVARAGSAASHWVELPEEGERVRAALERLLMLVRSVRGPQRIVLDDVPATLGLDGQVWTRLNALFESCYLSGTQLLMTAKGVPEDQVDSRFRGASVQVLAVPVLTGPEVESFFESLGCPAETRETWTKSTLMQSGNGHPKLVYLRGLELRDQGWPMPTIDAFLKSPESIEEARANARQTVNKIVPEPDKSYLYTLSVAALPFSRELALKIGDMMGIPAPGEAFDRLSGRWIEAKGRNLYTVTNLLNNQARQTYSAEQLAKAHSVLFDAFASEQSINVNEAWGIFLQAFQTCDRRRFGGFLASLVSLDFKSVPGLAESLEILLSMATGNMLVGPYDASTSAMFRHLQFKIALHVKPEMVAEIARQWAWTIEQIEDEQVRRGATVIRGLSIAISIDANLPPDVMVQAISDAVEFEKFDLNKPNIPYHEDLVKTDGTLLGHVGLFFMFAQSRCDGFQFVEATLSALEKIEPNTRSRMLEAFDTRGMEHVSMIAKAWLIETKCEQPNWQGLLHALDRANSLGKQWSSRGLGQNVARIQSIIYEEEEAVRDPLRAIAVLDEAKKDFGGSPVLDEQRANIEFRRGNHAVALELWEHSLDLGLNDPVKLRDPFAFRKAAIAASKVGRYDKAATILESAEQMTDLAGAGPIRAAFDVDAAYCWFKHKDPTRALETLAKGAVQLKDIYDPATQFQLFRAQKHCGSCALWIEGQVFPDEPKESDEPIVGMPTSPDQQELIATLPPSPYPITAVMILRVASRLGIDGPFLEQLRLDASSSRIPVASFQLVLLLVKESIAKEDFTDLGHKILQWYQAFWQLRAARESGADPLAAFEHEVPAGIKSNPMGADWYFVLALAILKMHGEDPQAWISRWREQISSGEDISMLLSELQVAVEAFSMDLRGALIQLRAEPSIISLAAAAIVLAQPARRPIDTCHAQIGFLTWLFSGPFIRDIFEATLPHLADLFANQWNPHISFPAGLINPRVSIPALHEAMMFQGTAPERLQKLLAAGSLATGLQIPSSTTETLSKIKNSISKLNCFKA